MRYVLSLNFVLLALLSTTTGAQGVPSVDGSDWSWSSVERLRLPREFVVAMGPLLGIVPEGENTHALCESAGYMALIQTGSSFEGQASRIHNVCETTGGQLFQQPSQVLMVADGEASVHTLHFSFESVTVKPCPHEAVIAEMDDDGRATRLAGSGWCLLPGHPGSQSPVDVAPPPGGTSKTLNWEAVRQ